MSCISTHSRKRFLEAMKYVLYPLIHGIELVSGHDIPSDLLVPTLGVLGELRDFAEEVINRVSHDLDFVVEVFELRVLGLVLGGRGVLELLLLVTLRWQLPLITLRRNLPLPLLLLLLLLARYVSSWLFPSDRRRGCHYESVRLERVRSVGRSSCDAKVVV